MLTLGINAAFHDSAACIIRDGVVLAAVEEERFTHIKHAKRPVPFTVYELPFHAIDHCLKTAGVTLTDLDHVAYSFAPALLPNSGRRVCIPPENGNGQGQTYETPWDPLMPIYVENAPLELLSGVPHHLEKRWRNCRENHFQWHFVNHRIAHAASAFLASPFKEAAIMALDGRGEVATTSYYMGDGRSMDLITEVNMPHSLGLLYEEVTDYLGFLRSSDEYKVMALASFGRPAYIKQFEEIIELIGEGQYRINSARLRERFGAPRPRGGEYEKKHFDIAHSLQHVLEERVIALGRWLHEKTSAKNLCLAGGVALNCVMNSKIRDRGPYQSVWVQPAAGDAGTALGAALWIDSKTRTGNERPWVMNHAYLGPEYSDTEIENFLIWTKVPFRKLSKISAETASLLAKEKVIGWFQGKMEFGPRALGSRSILASPLHPEMQDRLNEIKDREDFRPVAPVVLEEKCREWFVDGHPAPFMLFVFDVRPECADRIPAVRHIDGTARVQTVNRVQNSLYYDLICEFEKLTGVPVLVNTSFNTRGEPIVCTPRDAIECFWTSPLDALVIGSYILEKQSG